MIEISEVQPTLQVLALYGSISTSFEVRSCAEHKGLNDGAIVEVPAAASYMKDAANEDPRDWRRRYELERWGFFMAKDDSAVVGGCAVATGMSSLYFESDPSAALLWDIRVAPESRGRGIGTALLEAAAGWAAGRGCADLLVETQDSNVSACRLYLSCHFTVREIRPGVYDEWPDDALVVFQKALRNGATS